MFIVEFLETWLLKPALTRHIFSFKILNLVVPSPPCCLLPKKQDIYSVPYHSFNWCTQKQGDWCGTFGTPWIDNPRLAVFLKITTWLWQPFACYCPTFSVCRVQCLNFSFFKPRISNSQCSWFSVNVTYKFKRHDLSKDISYFIYHQTC